MFNRTLLPAWVGLLPILTSGVSLAQEAAERKEVAAGERYQAVAETVLLDLVVRDRSGRPVRDLRPDEIEVYENGVRQQITGLRFLGEDSVVVDDEPAPVAAPDTAPPVSHPSGQLDLVTLAFDRLGNEARQLARQAALDFIRAGIRPNMMVAVFTIDQRLFVLQEYTNDADLIRAAVDRATTGAYSQFATQSEAIRRGLEEAGSASFRAESEAAGVGQGAPPSGGMGAAFAEARLAEVTVSMLQHAEQLQRQQQGHASLFSLLALVRAQRPLAGRKTVLYFSEGLLVPPNYVDIFRTTISEANLAHVSVYAVDARGLITGTRMGAARDMLLDAADVSRRQLLSGGGRSVSREEVMLGETAEATLRMDVQGTLADLSESTGGFLIANTNDTRRGMRQINEDMRSYFELSYTPRDLVYDGRFRAIEVRILRPDVTVQTRSGYFALPPGDGPITLAYEVPMLAALSSTPMPTDIEFRAGPLRFPSTSGAVEYSLVVQVPLAEIDFERDTDADLYRTRFSLLCLVKDAQGEVIEKFSQDYPLEGPLDRLEPLRRGDVVFIREFVLPPGRYSLETAVHDHRRNRTSGRRSVLVVPTLSESIRMSSISLVRRLDRADETPAENPFVFDGMKVVPDLGDTTFRGNEPGVPIYTVVYPAPGASEPPEIVLELIHNGEVLARTSQVLGSPDQRGRIPYAVTIPLEGLSAGRYQIRLVAVQGESAAAEHIFFRVEP
jgi:VWFA-related protein